MLNEPNSRRRLVVFVVLVALCLAMLAVSGTAPVQELRRGVHFAAAPVQERLSDGTRSVTAVLSAFGEIDALRRENLALQSSVQQLQEQLGSLDAVLEENKRLSRLLDIRDRLEFTTTAAGVTSRQATQFERLITIDRGTEVGISKGAPVLSEGGALAGKVTEVGNGWAAVMLISDTRSLVTGLDSRTRATGEVTGRLAAPLAMANIPVTDKIAVNDRIVTAGIDLGKRFRSFYPKNIPIGRVVDVQLEPGSIVQTALLQPAADLEHIEDVLVLTDFRLSRGTDADVPEVIDDPAATDDPGDGSPA
jgi:rod shape-determining protein MreC